MGCLNEEYYMLRLTYLQSVILFMHFYINGNDETSVQKMKTYTYFKIHIKIT